jgi:hypothetical protein
MTNEEIAREVDGGRPRPSRTATSTPTPTSTSTAPPTLSFLTTLFDRTFYGGLPVSPADAEEAVRAARRIGSAEARR